MKKLIISVAALTLAGASALSFAQSGNGAAGPGGGSLTSPTTPVPSQASPTSPQTPTPGAQTMTPSDPHPSSSHSAKQKKHSTTKKPTNGNTGNGATNAPDNAPGKAQ